MDRDHCVPSPVWTTAWKPEWVRVVQGGGAEVSTKGDMTIDNSE
jgi:hypothetical protein